MNPSKPRNKRSNRVPHTESLETRSLMTGGLGNTFALVPVTIEKAGQPADLNFTIQPSHFTRPNGRIIVGVDVASASSTQTITPKVSQINTKEAGLNATGTGANRRANRDVRIERNNTSSAVIVTLNDSKNRGKAPTDYVTRITAGKDQTGPILVGYYLPGDANGDGTVTNADSKLVRSKLGQTMSMEGYSFDADADRDGRITQSDVRLTTLNRGAKTTVSPVLTANLDPATDTGAPDRITDQQVVAFNGEATPGATVTFTDISGKIPTRTVTTDAAGKYRMELNLAPGANTFRVSTADSFGQTISGQLSPVVYNLKANA